MSRNDRVERNRVPDNSRESYRAFFENANDIIVILDEAGNFTAINPRAQELTGLDPAEWIGRHFTEVVAPEYHEMLLDYLKRVGRGEQVPYIYEIEIIGSNGNRIPLEISDSVVRSNDNLVAVQVIGRDITERKKDENRIRRLKEFSESIISNVPVGILTIDATGTVTSANPAQLSIMGGPDSPEELVGVNLLELPTVKEAGVDQAIEKALRGERVSLSPFAYTSYFGKRKLFLEAVIVPMKSPEGAIEGVIILIQDVTERVRLEKELIQSEKLSAVGELISGIAHELNNPLTGVIGYTQLLLDSECEEKVRHDLNKVYHEALRCQKIVRNLLAFARRHRLEKKYGSINDVIDSTLELRMYQLTVDNIEVVKNLDPKLPSILADFSQLQQVFLNILTNAHHAMRPTRRGTLAITTEYEGDTLRAIFADTGSGIAEEDLKKIFDPFFTTKDVGQGAGLGLSLSYGIIKEHGGNIHSTSRVGEGSTFTVELPIVRDDAPSPEPSVEMGGGELKGKSILVVDDEQIILDLLIDVFQGIGHFVDTAKDGGTAIEKISYKDYDAIITDMKMPGMDGQEFYDYLCEHKPALVKRLIFTTGDIVASEIQDFFEQTGNRHIHKPFNIKVLQETVEYVLREGG